jgi:1,4-dihydroxy-6-naphthoate synthase
VSRRFTPVRRALELSLGFSPCPNDTFVFDALVHGGVAADGLRFRPRLEDVETLNRLALEGTLDVAKVSYGALPDLLDRYVLLRSGGALGRGCGPILVARPGSDLGSVRSGSIAVPGHRTTANLLLRLWDPALRAGVPMVYDEIMPAVAAGRVDAGLIIHESRFTYPAHGLIGLLDLGEWWEAETGLPIPLGGIVARRALGAGVIAEIEGAIRRSVEHALTRPDESLGYRRRHAQEMDDEVMRAHIELYVNRFTVDLGTEGEGAVRELMRRATDDDRAADPLSLRESGPGADPEPGHG